MINLVPSSWTYTDKLENLFLFFQSSEELLSFTSPDSFSLPVCNSISLCYEIYNIYQFLQEGNQLERYYSKYIPCILDELIDSIHEDFLIKKVLGPRLDSIMTGLEVAKTTPSVLSKWIHLIMQYCPHQRHADLCKEKIIEYVLSNSSKTKLLWCTKNYYIDLIYMGYSTEHLHQSVLRFFDNRSVSITAPEDILTFLQLFDYKSHRYTFSILADTYKLDNLFRSSPAFSKELKIHEVPPPSKPDLEQSDTCYKVFWTSYDSQKAKTNGSSIKVISCESDGRDPYSAYEKVEQIFELAQAFEGYFKHKSERKMVFNVIVESDGRHIPIKPRKTIPNRPYIEQDIINQRIETILFSKNASPNAIYSILNALEMHLDALNCRNAETMLRTFWSAIETLFFYADENDTQESTKYCLLHIIQKTYILKQFRLIYNQLTDAINDQTFWESISATDFRQFVQVFMSFDADAPEFKNLTNHLSDNPLLRSRTYWFRKELSSCKNVLKKIESHKQRVSWHIDRIYRTRNLSTHAGISMPYNNDILFNIHNYFDYCVNFLLCKLESGEYIRSISSVIFEAKNDNEIHLSLLKKTDNITPENYLACLFGPDQKIVEFKYE